MENFGANLDTEKIFQIGGFYSSLSDFKRFLLFVLNQYLMEDNTFKMYYDPKTGEFIKDETYKSPYKKFVMDRINLKNIGFCNAGFAYSEDNKELAVVSPEYFMIHLLDDIKKSNTELYSAFLKFQKDYGNDVLDNLSFKKVHEDLYNKYRSESEKTNGLYRLTETKTPAEYNTMNPNPLEFEITATHEETAVEPKLLTLKGNVTTGDVSFESSLENGSLTAKRMG